MWWVWHKEHILFDDVALTPVYRNVTHGIER